MTRTPARLAIACLLIVLVGCTAHRHMKAGDAAVAGGDMHAAVRAYALAIEHDPSLSRDRAFMRKYASAEARVAYQEAVRLRGLGAYEPAAQQLRVSIERDPSYDKPVALLRSVLIEASAARYVRAVESADEGDVDAARRHLELALQQNPDNERAASALASLTPGKLPAQTPGLNAYLQGMQHSAAKRWPEAERHLNQAVIDGPGLLSARIALFETRRELAGSQRLTAEADDLINERSIGPALDRLRLALEVWPFNEQATQRRAEALRLRAQADAKLAEATELAGKRRWEQAIARVEAALSLDHSHAGARKALTRFKEAGASDYVEQGEGLLQQGRLLEAERSFGRATELDRGLAAASAGLGETRMRLAKARGLMQAGAGHIAVLQMSGAIASLNQSLEIWPFNDEAQALLQQAEAQQAQARERFAASARLAERQAWDPAIALADEALALDRSYDGLAAHRKQLPQRAAADYTQRADESLAKNQLDDARADYHKALSYVARYSPALSGLASAYHASGKAHEAKERYGAALLDYTLGRSYQPEHAVGKSWELARQLVRNRVGMGLAVEVDPGPGGAVGPDQLGRSLTGVLNRYTGKGLEVGGAASPYTLRVTIGQAQISTRLIGSVNRTHDYTIPEQRHNPAYDHAHDQLQHALSALTTCRNSYEHAAREHDHAERRAERLNPGPAPRKPRGSKPTPPRTKGINTDDAEYQRQLARYEREQQQYRDALADYQRKARAYKRAKAEASSLGSRCNDLHNTLSRHEREVNHCRRRLSNTPKLVWVDIPHTWHYTVQTHEKRGDLAVSSQLIDNATGKVVDRAGHHADSNDRDTLRLNANPDIGVRRDQLSLPSDHEVRGALSADLADDASPWAVQAAVKHRLDGIYRLIGKLEQAQDPAGALEARVDAVVLTGVVDPEGSSKRLADLASRQAGSAE